MQSLSFAAPSTERISQLVSTVVVVGLELALVAALTAALTVVGTRLIGRVSALGGRDSGTARVLQARTRRLLLAAAAVIAVAIVGYNGWLVVRGVDVRARTLALLGAIGTGFWTGLASAFLTLAAATIGVLLVLRILRMALTSVEAWLNRWDQLQDNDRGVRAFFAGVNRTIGVTAWMLLAVFALGLMHAPQIVVTWSVRGIRAYLVIAVGLLLVRASLAIGIFFLGRVIIELGRFEITRRLLAADGLDETTRRRRETIAPLARTTFTYGVYFAASVLILASLGFNPMPFLAGAGILGLVIGFGAQSLVNDVVSGFFILFENTYLVGDSIEVSAAKGTVEAIEFRTTKIRDADGRMHIVRNGDVKEVVNYSKGYMMAVIPVRVAYDADLRAVCSVLQEAGQRVRERNEDVTGDTLIEGIVDFGEYEMTVRTTTRVKPGRHEAAAADLRFAIKEAFDRRADGPGRFSLVPSTFAARTVIALSDRFEAGLGPANGR